MPNIGQAIPYHDYKQPQQKEKQRHVPYPTHRHPYRYGSVYANLH